MSVYTVVTFYKFNPLPDYENRKPPLLALMQEYNVLGTIILASEGINGTICGFQKDVLILEQHLRSFPGFSNLECRNTYSEFNPFEKAKVKLRNEIVTMGAPEVNPLEVTGEHLAPEEWNELIADPNVVLIDTRNDYEIKLGTFKGAVSPETDNFRDFPEYVEKNLLDKKDKKIAMYCTGGIRCEKSTAYLKKLGFNQVYQLKGGILNYLEKIPVEQSKWEGHCFVFDDRVALDHQLKGFEKGSIDLDWKNNNKKKKAFEES